MTRSILLLSLAVGLAGCVTTPRTAVVDGRQVPRLDLEFGGQAFTVKHEGAHPRPGRPNEGLKDAGGSIRGRVCGMMVDFEVSHRGDHIDIVGSLDNHMPAAIKVTESNGVRQFTGNLGNAAVEFTLGPADVLGHVGIRVFALESNEDHYQGFARIPGLYGDGRIGVTLNGRAALWQLPAADQGAILPALLTCNPGNTRHFKTMDDLVVGVGGQVTDQPDESSAVYTRH